MSGVYVSWPFCPHKCSFCNFASGVFPKELEAEYGHAVVRHLQQQEWPWTPDTVYFGGGTPSMMDPAMLRAILDAIPGRPWREATVEALPGRLTSVSEWQGINRVSLGVQSFVPEELDQTGRRHTAEEVAAGIRMLRDAGIRNICLDLIAGLPHQTAGSWNRSLDWVGRLEPEHVSIYLLEVDEDSRLGLEVLQGGSRYGAPHVPDESLQADLYEIAVERLAGLGLRRYEISNFARPGFESIHNSKYWRLEPYLGFGADAHSFDGRRRWTHAETPGEYVSDARPVQVENARLEEERFYLGLRMLEGIPEAPGGYDAEIASLVDRGLLERSDHRLRLSSKGVLLSNEVFQEFVR